VDCSGDDGGFSVAGDHIRVTYGDHGFWFDTAAGSGLEILPAGRTVDPGAWVDVSAPGTPVDQMSITFGSTHFVGGYGSGGTDFEITCANSIRMGDVIGAVHEYEVSWGYSWLTYYGYITKTELWNEAGESMLIHYWARPSLAAGTENVEIQRFMDPDIDWDEYGMYTTTFERAPDSAYTAAIGPSSNWTVGWGSCQSYGRGVGGFDGWGAADADAELCDPDDLTADISLGFDWSDTASYFSPMTAAFVMSVGNTPENAESDWTDNAADFCDTLWDDWGSTVFFDDCGGGIIW